MSVSESPATADTIVSQEESSSLVEDAKVSESDAPQNTDNAASEAPAAAEESEVPAAVPVAITSGSATVPAIRRSRRQRRRERRSRNMFSLRRRFTALGFGSSSSSASSPSASLPVDEQKSAEPSASASAIAASDASAVEPVCHIDITVSRALHKRIQFCHVALWQHVIIAPFNVYLIFTQKLTHNILSFFHIYAFPQRKNTMRGFCCCTYYDPVRQHSLQARPQRLSMRKQNPNVPYAWSNITHRK